MCVYIWGIPRQIDQAKTLTIFFCFFFSFKYVIDGQKNTNFQIFLKISLST